jgi:glycerol uptake facilitator-like aquaporin
MTPVKGMLYTLAQCLGAVLGAAIVWGSTASDILMDLTDGNPPFLIGSNSVQPDLPLGSAFLAECMGTFLLVLTVMMTAVFHRSIAGNIAPIAIGWSVLLAHLVLVPLTGCGINPARSLGPMLVVIMAGGKVGYEGWWIYYTAPFVGSAAATFICMYLFGVYGDCHEKKEDPAADATAKEVAEAKSD